MAETGSSGYPKREHEIIATETALIVTLTEEHQAAARACLERSGKVTFSLKRSRSRGSRNHDWVTGY